MPSKKIRKYGWNTGAAILGPFWYLSRGMGSKGIILLLTDLFTIGLGIIPIAIYCGFNANHDYYSYLKSKGHYIYR